MTNPTNAAHESVTQAKQKCNSRSSGEPHNRETFWNKYRSGGAVVCSCGMATTFSNLGHNAETLADEMLTQLHAISTKHESVTQGEKKCSIRSSIGEECVKPEGHTDYCATTLLPIDESESGAFWWPPLSTRAERSCTKPPIGYLCTRKQGHDGPCAPYPLGSKYPDPNVEKGGDGLPLRYMDSEDAALLPLPQQLIRLADINGDLCRSHNILLIETADLERKLRSALEREERLKVLLQQWMVARPIAEYHEDLGCALWFEYPIVEPPYVGTPNDCDWPGYHTHFVRLTNEMIPVAAVTGE